MARLGNLIAAKYNKAEAVEFFMKDLPNCDTAVFVDDNFDNVFNVYSRFAQLELKASGLVTMHSVWYEPPADGKPEPFNARNVTLGLSIARPLPTTQNGPLSARCVFGAAGTLHLHQADGLAKLEARWEGTGELSHVAFAKHQHETLSQIVWSRTLFGTLTVIGHAVSVTLKNGEHHSTTVEKE